MKAGQKISYFLFWSLHSFTKPDNYKIAFDFEGRKLQRDYQAISKTTSELGKDLVNDPRVGSWYWLPISFKIRIFDLESAPITALLNPNRLSVPFWMMVIKYSISYYSLNGGHLTSAPSSSPPSCESYEWNTSSSKSLWWPPPRRRHWRRRRRDKNSIWILRSQRFVIHRGDA